MEDKKIRQFKSIATGLKKQNETEHGRISLRRRLPQEEKENNQIAILNLQNRACEDQFLKDGNF